MKCKPYNKQDQNSIDLDLFRDKQKDKKKKKQKKRRYIDIRKFDFFRYDDMPNQ